MESNLAVVYYHGSVTTTHNGVKFECCDPKTMRIKEDITLDELKQKIHGKVRAGSRRVAEVSYRCPTSDANGNIQYFEMQLLTAGDIARMFAVFGEYSRYGPIELYAVLARSADEVLACLRGPRSADEIIANLRQGINSSR